MYIDQNGNWGGGGGVVVVVKNNKSSFGHFKFMNQ